MNENLFGVTVPQRIIDALEEAGPRAGLWASTWPSGAVRALRAIPGIAGVHIMALGRDEVIRRVVEGAGLFPRPV